MTRGTFVLITNDRVFISIQFNGDMYFWEPGHGNNAMAAIRNIRKPEDFEVAILEFNRMHHDYELDEKKAIEARNKNHLLKAKENAVEMGLKEGADFGLIRDLCLTELEPEDEDGRTTTGIWFRPLPDDVAHEISRKYQLYK